MCAKVLCAKVVRFRKRKQISAYMTLEASFLVPWVIFLMIFLIYFSFYLYDRCVLFQDAYALCFRSSIQKIEEPVSYINANKSRQFGTKYFGTGGVIIKTEQSGKEVNLYASCDVKVPFSHFITMAKKDGWNIRTQAKAQRMNPTRIIRKCRMAEHMIEK